MGEFGVFLFKINLGGPRKQDESEEKKKGQTDSRSQLKLQGGCSKCDQFEEGSRREQEQHETREAMENVSHKRLKNNKRKGGEG